MNIAKEKLRLLQLFVSEYGMLPGLKAQALAGTDSHNFVKHSDLLESRSWSAIYSIVEMGTVTIIK